MRKLAAFKGFAVICWVLVVLLVIFKLLFREYIYPSLPVAANEPYGAGDVIELLIYLIMFSMCALLAVIGVVFIGLKNYRLAAIFLLSGLAVPTAFYL